VTRAPPVHSTDARAARILDTRRLQPTTEDLDMNADSEIVKTELPNGKTLYIEVRRAADAGPRPVSTATTVAKFTDLMEPVEAIADMLFRKLQQMPVPRATIEFAVDVGIESGSLTAMIVRGTASANLKITLEWMNGKHQ
jgi:Trypsin-co-occurring domain 1